MKINDLLSLIPTLITALAGLITAILGFIPALANIRKKDNRKGTTSSLKFLKISRIPIDKRELQRFKKNNRLFAAFCGFFVVIIFAILIFAILRFILVPGSFSTEILHFVFGFISFFILIINLIIYFYLLYLFISFNILVGENPEDAKYYLFQEVKIVVEGEYKDIFFRVKEILWNVSQVITEYDFESGTVEANVSIGLKFDRKVIRVKVDRIENNRCLIQVKLTPFYFKELPSAITSYTWVVNNFLKQAEGY